MIVIRGVARFWGPCMVPWGPWTLGTLVPCATCTHDWYAADSDNSLSNEDFKAIAAVYETYDWHRNEAVFAVYPMYVV